MAKSKARYLSDVMQDDGSSVFVGNFSVPADFVIDPDGSPTGLGNDSLQNSSITINSYNTSLGSSVTLVTDDIAEEVSPTNLWFTNARARSSISITDSGGDGSLAYNNGTGVITYTGPSATEVRAHLSGGTGVTITNGDIAIGQAIATSDSVTFDTLTVSTTASIPYDNSISGLTATTVQSALSELTVLTGGGNVGSQASWNIYEFTTTASQTTFDLSALSPSVSYVPGYIQVYLNGILLAESEYTASNGSTVVLNSGATLGHSISIVVLDSFNTATQLRVLSIDAAAPDNSVSISSSGALATGGFTFPTADGSADQVLKTDGSGSLSFQPIPTSLVVGQRTAPVAVSVVNAQFTVASRSGNVTIGVS